MKTKNEIYLVVDTPKKAKKLLSVLDMFKEEVYSFTRGRIEKENAKELEVFPVLEFAFCKWQGNTEPSVCGKQKVSIKELRNILAVEHLKEGDFVVCSDFENIAVGLFEEYDNSFGFTISKPVYLNDLEYKSVSNGGCFDNFIRYATEEEKALLVPKEEKKELELGKWYKSEHGSLCYYLGNDYYGFDCNGTWRNECGFDIAKNGSVWQESTTQEVKQALVKEAEKRYKVGDKVVSLVGGNPVFSISEFKFNQFDETGDLWVSCDNNTKNSLILRNGKWAEVLQQPSKEAEITDQDIDTFEDLSNQARLLAEKLRELNTKTK